MLPEIRITDSIVLPTYFVYLSLLYSALIMILPIFSKKFERNTLIAMNISFVLMISGFAGARLFHVFFENWNLYRSQPIFILYFWSGGYVFYGGAITAAICAFLYLRKIHEPIDYWFDFFAPLLALGYGLGRISCFLAGCCYGKICDLPWAINGLHPTQLYASFWELGAAAILFILLKKKLEHGLIFWIWVATHSIGRMIMEYFRADFRGDFYFGISISSWISIVLFASATTMILQIRKLSKN